MQQRYVDDYSALSSCGALIKFELFIYPKKPYELETTKGTTTKNNKHKCTHTQTTIRINTYIESICISAVQPTSGCYGFCTTFINFLFLASVITHVRSLTTPQ